MRFGHAAYLNWLWLVIILIIFFVWAFRKRVQLTEKFCGETMISRLVSVDFREQAWKHAFLMTLSVFFLILALAQPRWGYHWEDLRQEGVDIVVALDVSNSMLAGDIKPNRLERAKRKISDLLHMLEGDRIGLVIFAGRAFVQCPMTLDYSTAKMFLDAIDTTLISVQGTNLDEAIRTSAKAFRIQGKKSRAIILITDGEDQTGNALKTAKWAAEQGIKIFTMGVGQDLGAPIPNMDSGGGFKKDSHGEVILTRLDETVLKNIALTTGGSYVRSVTGDLDLKKIYLEKIKQTLEKTEIKSQRRKIWQERFQWLVFLALLCLLVDSLVVGWKPIDKMNLKKQN